MNTSEDKRRDDIIGEVLSDLIDSHPELQKADKYWACACKLNNNYRASKSWSVDYKRLTQVAIDYLVVPCCGRGN